MTRLEFELVIIADIINGYPEYKEKLQKQLSIAAVKDRKLSTYGFSTDYIIDAPNEVTLGNDIQLMLETDGCRVNELDRGSGYILWIKNGLIHSLEGYSYKEPWPKEILFCEKS